MNELTNFVYEKACDLANSSHNDSGNNNNTNLNMAELLVKKAQSNGSNDNITAIFVLLKENLNQITKPVQN
jgi:serine/threonine protein phosphatase PrpC